MDTGKEAHAPRRRSRVRRPRPRIAAQTRTKLLRRLLNAIDALKRHPNRWVRRGLGVLLILGGVLGFLPILGVWMIPLGLAILSDEHHWLRRPRRRLQVWLGYRFPQCRMPEA